MSKNGSLIAPEILIVDDEEDIRELIAGILHDEGFETRTAGDSDGALAAVRQRRPQLVVLDIWLQGSRHDGIQVLDNLKRDHPDLPVVMISGHGTIETAVASIRKGAYDFIEKPFKSDRLIHVCERALEAARLKREVQELKLRAGDDCELIGASSAISQLRQAIEKIAPTGSRVLITGQPGAGKEVVARLIHAHSRRAGNAFVAVNCATMAPDRIEAELFGEESAEGLRKIGLFELAHNGTLYLDEVSDMPLETQGKILRVLVDQTFQRVGGTTRVQVDARVISSTVRDLRAEIASGRLREDLYHRLNVVPVRVPPLSERRDDIPLLVAHFMKRLSAASGLPMRDIGDDAMAVLQAHSWPGNVRQLRNIVERLLILASDDPAQAISADLLPHDLGAGAAWNNGGRGDLVISLPLREAREIFEREYLLAQINRFGGNISRTAAFIGMERSALHRKLKSLGVGTPGGPGNGNGNGNGQQIFNA
jgi:two-component system nitrogen regulation response regulator NtrX